MLQSTIHSANHIWRNVTWSRGQQDRSFSVTLHIYFKVIFGSTQSVTLFWQAYQEKNPPSFQINYISRLFSFTRLLETHGIRTILKCYRTLLCLFLTSFPKYSKTDSLIVGLPGPPWVCQLYCIFSGFHYGIKLKFLLLLWKVFETSIEIWGMDRFHKSQ